MKVLEEFNLTMSIEEVGEDLKTGLKDKTAGVRVSLVQWMLDHLEKKSTEGVITDRLKDFLKSNSLIGIV